MKLLQAFLLQSVFIITLNAISATASSECVTINSMKDLGALVNKETTLCSFDFKVNNGKCDFTRIMFQKDTTFKCVEGGTCIMECQSLWLNPTGSEWKNRGFSLTLSFIGNFVFHYPGWGKGYGWLKYVVENMKLNIVGATWTNQMWGAIRAGTNSNVNLCNNTFIGSRYMPTIQTHKKAKVSLNGCTFRDCTGQSGRAAVEMMYSDSFLSIKDSVFDNSRINFGESTGGRNGPTARNGLKTDICSGGTKFMNMEEHTAQGYCGVGFWRGVNGDKCIADEATCDVRQDNINTEEFEAWVPSETCDDMWHETETETRSSRSSICARATGDPHMATFDGLKYDCQGDGDFILSKSLESSFEFQGRFETVPGTHVTTTQGVVLNTGFTGEPKVEVAYTKQCDLKYIVDGTVKDLETDKDTGSDNVRFWGQGQQRDFIFTSGVSLKVYLQFYRGDCYLSSYICVPAELAEEPIVGILGSPDGQSSNDFMDLEGTVLTPQPSSRAAKNQYCTSTWCVPSISDNLFQAQTEGCIDEFDEELYDAIDNPPEDIKELCGDSEACIVDAIADDNNEEAGKRALEDETRDPKAPTEKEIDENPDPPMDDPKTIADGSPTVAPTKAPTPTPIENRNGSDPVEEKSLSSVSGDPHFKTWSGDKYDYHGECDLVLVDNPSFANGLGLRVHIRTTRVKYFSFIEKVAIRIGDEILEFSNDVENFLINGVPVPHKKKHHKTKLGGFDVRRDSKAISVRLQDGTVSHQEGGTAKIDLHARKNGFPAVVVDGGSTDIFKGSLGLLGEWSTGRTLARDGKTEIPVQQYEATNFALEWQVRDDEPMLFKEARFPQYPTTCLPPGKMVGRIGASLMEVEVEEACAHWKEDKEDCIFDVMATRDVLVAEEGHLVHVM